MSEGWQYGFNGLHPHPKQNRGVRTFQDVSLNLPGSTQNPRRVTTIQDLNLEPVPYYYPNTAPIRRRPLPPSPSPSPSPSPPSYSLDRAQDEYTRSRNGYASTRGVNQPNYRLVHVPLPWEVQEPSDIQPSSSPNTSYQPSYTTNQTLGPSPNSQGINEANLREAAGRAAENRRLEDRTRGKPKLRAREAARAARIAKRNARLPSVGRAVPHPVPATARGERAPEPPQAQAQAQSDGSARMGYDGRVLGMQHNNADGRVDGREPVPAHGLNKADGRVGGRGHPAPGTDHRGQALTDEPAKHHYHAPPPSVSSMQPYSAGGRLGGRAYSAPRTQPPQPSPDERPVFRRPRQPAVFQRLRQPANVNIRERGGPFCSAVTSEPRHEHHTEHEQNNESDQSDEELEIDDGYDDRDARNDRQERKGPLSWLTSWL